jgi:ribose 5-phosphate isomerase A
MSPKQRAAEAALAFVGDGMVVGLGTGSTADFFLQALGAALRDGRLRGVRGVPTSRQSEQRARQLGIPLLTLGQCPRVDLTVDGADEIDPQLNLIKGLGGALLREKIVAQNSRRLIIVADNTKMVSTLGTRGPLPVEVVPFGHESQAVFLRRLGAEPVIRNLDGRPMVTDNGNYIYDCRFPAIHNPAELDTTLHSRAGIVETGLFVGIADMVLIGQDSGVQTRSRS